MPPTRFSWCLGRQEAAVSPGLPGSAACRLQTFRLPMSTRRGKGQGSELLHGHPWDRSVRPPVAPGTGRRRLRQRSPPGSRGIAGALAKRVLRLHLVRSRGGRQPAGPLCPVALWPEGRGGGDPAHTRSERLGSGAGESAPGTGEVSPSTGQGPLRGSRGPPAVPSHPVRDQRVPASPPRATSIASCLTLRLWSCRDSGVKFAEPSLFRCPH